MIIDGMAMRREDELTTERKDPVLVTAKIFLPYSSNQITVFTGIKLRV